MKITRFPLFLFKTSFYHQCILEEVTKDFRTDYPFAVQLCIYLIHCSPSKIIKCDMYEKLMNVDQRSLGEWGMALPFSSWGHQRSSHIKNLTHSNVSKFVYARPLVGPIKKLYIFWHSDKNHICWALSSESYRNIF